jgi:hypothetical protein
LVKRPAPLGAQELQGPREGARYIYRSHRLSVSSDENRSVE